MEVGIQKLTTPRNDAVIPDSYAMHYYEIRPGIYIALAELCYRAMSNIKSTPFAYGIAVSKYQLAVYIKISYIFLMHKSDVPHANLQQSFCMYIF